MADGRWNEDQEQISDDNVVGKAADEDEEFEDVDEVDEVDEADQEDNEDMAE
jgi:hypothetical protein